MKPVMYLVLSLQQRFNRLNKRDQIALVLLVLSLSLYLVLQGLVKPLQNAVALADQRVAAAGQSLERVRSLATRLQQSAEEPERSRGSIAAVVDSSAAEAGLVLASMEPGADGSSLSLRVEDSTLSSLLYWLDVLERDGLAVQTLTIVPVPQGQLVSASLRLAASR